MKKIWAIFLVFFLNLLVTNFAIAVLRKFIFREFQRMMIMSLLKSITLVMNLNSLL
jgi:hypothetical protein